MTTLRFFRSSLFVAVPAIFSLCLVSGCANRGYLKASTTADTMSTAAGEVDATQRQISEATNSARAVLAAPPAELKSTFERYRSAVSNLNSTVSQLRQRADDMDKQGEKYFAAWNAKTSEMQNESMRARSAARQQEVTAQFAKIRELYLTARLELDPLMSKLNDIRSMLSVDLTPAGVTNTREFVTNAEVDAKRARQILDQLAEGFRAMSTDLSPSGSPATAERTP